MERIYYTINEQIARIAKHINSFDDYVAGSTTAEYKKNVDRIKVESPKWLLAETIDEQCKVFC